MAHFAKINEQNIVVHVVTLADKDTQDSNGDEIESIGARYLSDGFGGNWKRTSYNTLGGIHKTGKNPFRKNYAGIGFSYDENRDAFIPPKPFESWKLNEETCRWEAPVPYPTDGKYHFWIEDKKEWESDPYL